MAQISINIDVQVPMRDGIALASDIWLPTHRRPSSTVLFRTPYDKTFVANSEVLRPEALARAGFSVVVQDTRGRFNSQGDWEPVAWSQEGQDGYDTVAWIAEQDWSSGSVGMAGQSYLGVVQLFTAALQPPALKAIAPHMASAAPFDFDETGGAFRLDHLFSWLAFMAPDWLRRRHENGGDIAQESLYALLETVNNPRKGMDYRPLTEVPAFTIPGFPVDPKSIFDGTIDKEAKALDLTQILVPSLHSGGWYDIFQRSTVGLWAAATRNDSISHLIMGPWSHSACLSQVQGVKNFGVYASARGSGITDLHIDFFKRYLDDIDVELPTVKFFIMGDDCWTEETTWPPKNTEDQVVHLAAFPSNSPHKHQVWHSSEGRLENTTTSRTEYVYDPAAPTPSMGGRTLFLGGLVPGPIDISALIRRRDSAAFISQEYQRSFRILGTPKARIWLACSAPDIDIIARLAKIDTAGQMIMIAYGALRGRYIDSVHERAIENFLTPNKPTLFEFTLGHTAQRIEVDERLALLICSADYPHLDPNLGNISRPGAGTASGPVNIEILHTEDHVSSVVIPLHEGDEHA